MSVLRQTSRQTPSVNVVVSFLMGRGAAVQPMPEAAQRWPSGTFRAFLPNQSTRGFALSVEGGRFTITVPTLACAEDRDLAWLLAAEVARGTGDDLEVDGVRVSLRNLAAHAGSSAVAFANDCAEIAGRAQRAVITLPGPNRDFHVGPRLVQRLGSDPAAWAAAMRRVQFGPIDDAPRDHRASERGQLSVVAVEPNTPAVLSWSDLVAFGPDEDALVVPFTRFVQLAADRAVALDERNVLLSALTPAEWEALVERAQPYAVDDLVETSPSGPFSPPIAVEIAYPDDEDSPVGPPILSSARHRDESRTFSTISTSKWAVPVFGSMLFALAMTLATALIVAFAVWLGQ